jgi:hypothetical protein
MRLRAVSSLRDFRKAEQLARFVAQRGCDAASVEECAVLTQMPAHVFSFPGFIPRF